MIIKLKAVIKETKEIVDVLAIDFVTKEISAFDEYSYYDFEEVILLKSTGLKDNKGVEIFEGDILEYETDLYEVIYEVDNARFIAQNFDGDYVYKEGDMFTFATIIGNIHTKENE